MKKRTKKLLLSAALLSAVLGMAPGRAQEAGPPSTLRLAQVVPRLPQLHLYVLSQDAAGQAASAENAHFSALAGNTPVPVHLATKNAGIGLVFLIDVSASMKPAQFAAVRKAVSDWIGSLQPEDQAAIVTFGEGVKLAQDFTNDQGALLAAVRPLQAHDQRTLLYQGLVEGIDLAHRLDPSLPLRRAIVVMTDGMDDQEGGAGRQEVVDKLALDPVPIYALGASRVHDAQVDAALKDFSSIARLSGGEYRRIDLKNLARGYNDLHGFVSATRHLVAECPACVPDGSAVPIKLLMADDTVRLSSGSVTVRMLGPKGKIVPPPPPPVQQIEPKPVYAPPPPPPPPQRSWINVTFSLFQNAPVKWLFVLTAIIAGLVLALSGMLEEHLKKLRELLNGRDKVNPPEKSVEKTKAIIWGEVVISSDLIPEGGGAGKRKARLYWLGRNDLKPVDILFEKEVSIGRASERDITIPNDSQVSGAHCTLAPKDGRILVRDTGSRNGTRVNGVPVPGFLHADADAVIGLGKTELRLKLLPAEAA